MEIPPARRQFFDGVRLPAGLIVLVDNPGPDALEVVGVGDHKVSRQGTGQMQNHLAVEGVQDPGAVQDQGHQAGMLSYQDGWLGLVGHF